MAKRPAAVPPSTGRKSRKKRRPSWDDVELVQMDEPTRFSDDELLADAIYVVRMLKQQRQHLSDLRGRLGHFSGQQSPHARCRRTGPKRGKYAKGGDGDWLLLYFGFVLVGKSAIFAFKTAPHVYEALVKECGFTEMPDYQTLRNRFRELEGLVEEIALEADAVIQRARRHEPRIGQFVLSDATAFETHARLEHCCPRSRKCKRAHWVDRASAKEVKNGRKDEVDATLADEEAQIPSMPTKITEATAALIPEALHPRGGFDFEHYSYYELDDCIYRSRDTGAGYRAYVDRKADKVKKHWHGGFGHLAIDFLVGAPLAVHAYSASETEFKQHPELVDRTIRALGEDEKGVQVKPLIWSTDAGCSYRSVFEKHTREGIASVIPFRGWGSIHTDDREKARTDLYDEYGVPRCRHCGGEGDQLAPGCGLVEENGEPYIRFKCSEGIFPECRKIQKVACAECWQLLVPLSRLHERYYDCRNAHLSFERLFKHWRDRYSVFGDDQSMRLKCWTNSVSAQRLRAEAARFLEWFRVCLRHGWIAGHKTLNEVRLWSQNSRNYGGWVATLAKRRKLRLDLPIGAAAERLGLITVTPRGAPPPPGVPPPAPVPDENGDIPF